MFQAKAIGAYWMLFLRSATRCGSSLPGRKAVRPAWPKLTAKIAKTLACLLSADAGTSLVKTFR
jgi:hypothetical protein